MVAESIQTLVEKFASNVRLQTEAIKRGDAKTGNLHAKNYIDAFKRLRTIGDEGREALAILLLDRRPDVRCMAAAFLLRHKTDLAKRVLRDLSEGKKGLTALGASEALKRWEEGTWQLDPE